MKQEELMESIYGCLERIENKISGSSMPQSAGDDAEADREVIQELNALKTGFKRVLEVLVMIKDDIANLQKRNSMPDKFMETLSVLKGEQQVYHKNRNELLERFVQIEKDTILYILEKMESLSTSVRNKMEESDAVCHRHNISIDTPYIFRTLIILIAYSIVVPVALCLGKQFDYNCPDNDLKYRYIKMKDEASPGQIGELENFLGLNRDEAGTEQMREDVEAYEDAVRRQATLAEQVRLKEQATKGQESKVKFIKIKQGQPKGNSKSRN